jgi:Mn2+/Fe2+ NRAMP family transporter
METPAAPAWSQALQGFFNPDMGGLSADLIFIIMANIGTTIAPWMIFFQQSAVVDKGIDIHDIKFGQIETFIGSVSTCIVAAFIIITTAAVFFYHSPPIVIEDAKQTAEALVPLLPAHGDLARRLYAIGLFDAGFLGALCISLSTSWAVGEVFGWAHSLNLRVREAPWFYLIYFLILVTSGAVVLIPGAPLVTITMFVQIVAVTLLPAALVFLLILLNDRPLMGDFVNNRSQNIVNASIIILVIIMSGLLGISTLFPEFLK